MANSNRIRTDERIVIIDPQKDFTSPDGHYAKRHPGINQILDAKRKINKLLGNYPKEQLIIVISDYQKDQFEKGLSIGIPGTEGHAIDLDADERYTILSKTQHSCFSSSSFVHYLNSNHIKKLILCGFLAEYCVRQTAIDALDHHYQVALLKDCIGTGDDVQGKKENMLSALKERGAEVLDSWSNIFI